MNRRTTRRLIGAAGLLTIGLTATACFPANGHPETITLVGSDTTQDVMGAIATAYNADASWNSDPDKLVNVLSVQGTPLTAPADSDCAAITYHTPAGAGEVASPNGSGAGRDALRNSVNAGNGCIDVARSSGGPRAVPSDNATFEYYAYALDAVGWSSASAKAPANVTLSQLKGIYNCTFTDWSQVGGTAGAIKRYYPQAGSGTRSFFQSDVLGFDPTTFSSPSCPAVTLTQENSGETVALNGDQAAAVVPYSMANWIAQARGTQLDQRSGQAIKSLEGQSPVRVVAGIPEPNTGAGPIHESNVKLNNPTPAYPGIRYVFNVVDNTSVRYIETTRFVGFTNATGNTAKSPLCNGKYAATLTNYGFGPLDTTTSAHNLSGSTCRVFQP